MPGHARLSWLVIATHVPGDGQGGGVVRYTNDLVRSLAVHPDVDVHVLAQRRTAPFYHSLIGNSGRVHTTPNLATVPRSVLERTGRGISAFRRRFDVIHGVKHLLPARCRGLRVLTVHDMLFLDRPNDYPLAKRLLLRRPYLRSIRSADVLICQSDATRARLRAYLPAASAKAALVPTAVSSVLLEASSRPVHQLHGRRFALVVGDASPRKNLGLVVDLWSEVTRVAPDLKLVIVGPHGWGVTEYGQAYDRLRCRGELLHLGHVEDAQLRWCYENAALVLCPSLQEGFGLPAAEALAFDATLLTSDDPALCEVSGEAAQHLPGRDAHAWLTAILHALASPAAHPPIEAWQTRTWTDVAHETVQVVRGARELAGSPRFQ